MDGSVSHTWNRITANSGAAHGRAAVDSPYLTYSTESGPSSLTLANTGHVARTFNDGSGFSGKKIFHSSKSGRSRPNSIVHVLPPEDVSVTLQEVHVLEDSDTETHQFRTVNESPSDSVCASENEMLKNSVVWLDDSSYPGSMNGVKSGESKSTWIGPSILSATTGMRLKDSTEYAPYISNPTHENQSHVATVNDSDLISNDEKIKFSPLSSSSSDATTHLTPPRSVSHEAMHTELSTAQDGNPTNIKGNSSLRTLENESSNTVLHYCLEYPSEYHQALRFTLKSERASIREAFKLDLKVHLLNDANFVDFVHSNIDVSNPSHISVSINVKPMASCGDSRELVERLQEKLKSKLFPCANTDHALHTLAVSTGFTGLPKHIQTALKELNSTDFKQRRQSSIPETTASKLSLEHSNISGDSYFVLSQISSGVEELKKPGSNARALRRMIELSSLGGNCLYKCPSSEIYELEKSFQEDFYKHLTSVGLNRLIPMYRIQVKVRMDDADLSLDVYVPDEFDSSDARRLKDAMMSNFLTQASNSLLSRWCDGKKNPGVSEVRQEDVEPSKMMLNLGQESQDILCTQKPPIRRRNKVGSTSRGSTPRGSTHMKQGHSRENEDTFGKGVTVTSKKPPQSARDTSQGTAQCEMVSPRNVCESINSPRSGGNIPARNHHPCVPRIATSETASTKRKARRTVLSGVFVFTKTRDIRALSMVKPAMRDTLVIAGRRDVMAHIEDVPILLANEDIEFSFDNIPYTIPISIHVASDLPRTLRERLSSKMLSTIQHPHLTAALLRIVALHHALEQSPGNKPRNLKSKTNISYEYVNMVDGDTSLESAPSEVYCRMFLGANAARILEKLDSDLTTRLHSSLLEDTRNHFGSYIDWAEEQDFVVGKNDAASELTVRIKFKPSVSWETRHKVVERSKILANYPKATKILRSVLLNTPS